MSLQRAVVLLHVVYQSLTLGRAEQVGNQKNGVALDPCRARAEAHMVVGTAFFVRDGSICIGDVGVPRRNHAGLLLLHDAHAVRSHR